jgi:hypothetical protein
MENAVPRSRRTLLAGVGGALAALAAQALRPFAARAEGEVIHVGDNHDTARTITSLLNKLNDLDVIKAESKGSGRGMYGLSESGSGVQGNSNGFVGVYGSSRSGEGVRGTSSSSKGVVGVSSGGYAVEGRSYGDAASVHGLKHRALRTTPDGNAVLGEIKIDTSPRTAIVATTTGTGAGIRGTSAQGRGGLFEGPVAQVRLVPSVATHPATGAMGDLVADTSGRLWFCKGGGSWAQLA